MIDGFLGSRHGVVRADEVDAKKLKSELVDGFVEAFDIKEQAEELVFGLRSFGICWSDG